MDATEVDIMMQEEENSDTNKKKERKEESALSPSMVEKSVVGSSTNSQKQTAVCKNTNLDDSDVKMEEVKSDGNPHSDATSSSQFPLTAQEIRDIALPGERQGETSTCKKTDLGFSREDITNRREIKDKSLEDEAYAGASFDLLPACKENTVEVCQKEGPIMDDKKTDSTMPKQVMKESDRDLSKSQPPGLAPPGIAPPGIAPPGIAPPGIAPPGITPPRIAPPRIAPPRIAPPGIAPPGLVPPGLEPPGLVPPGLEPPGLVPPGLEPSGLVPPGLEPPGLVPPGLEPPGLVPPGLEPPGLAPPGLESLVSEKKRKVICEVCGKYIRASNMKNHMRIHTGERPFPCDMCPKTFSHINHQKQHMRIHTGEKPFTCKICNMSFRKKCQFVKHWQKHMQNNPFTCDVCSKTFPRWDILTKHKAYHAKEKAHGSDNKQRRMEGKGYSQRNLILGCVNVRGCTSESKRNDIGSLMQERKIDVLALSETHLKGKGEVMFGNVKGQGSGVEEGFVKDGVAILVCESLQDKILEYKYVSPRIMWVRMKIDRECWVFLSAYGPGYDTIVHEHYEFWSRLTRCLDKLQKRANVVVLGDLNARVGSSVIRGVVGRYGVPGRDENGMRLLDMCLKKKLAIGNTFFKKKMIHKYTHTQMVYGGMKDKAMTDYVLITRRVFGRLKDVHVHRGVAAISDHFLVKTKLAVGRVRPVKGARGEGSSGGGEANKEMEEPGHDDSDLIGEVGAEDIGVPGKSDSDEVPGQADSDEEPGQADSDEEPDQADSDEEPDQADSDEEPGQADSDGVPGQADSDGVPGQADSDGVPGQADSDVVKGQADSDVVKGQADSDVVKGQADTDGVPGQCDTDGVPRKADSDGVPGKADSIGEPSKADSDGEASKADNDGEPGKADSDGEPVKADSDGEPGKADRDGEPANASSDGVPSKAVGDVIGEVGAEGTGAPGQAEGDVVEVGTKRTREETEVPGEADSDGAGEVGAKKAREETEVPGKADSDVAGEVRE